VKVYRIEHLMTGKGPYTNGDDAVNVALDSTDFSSRHPAPCNDGIWESHTEGFDYPHYRYGFESVDSLLDWFDSDAMQVLIDNGYVVATYYVPNGGVRVGYCHLAFDHDAARLLAYDDTVPVRA
jgi:hypothetical protein